MDESNRVNTGFLKFDCDIEMQAGIFNTSNSNLWTKLQRVFAQEIRDEYAKMRQAKFTEENLMKYLYGEQISQIPQRNYNLDMQNKYLNFGNQFLHALHGNGYSHMKRWVRERLFFLDTLLDYTVSSADYITIRANKQGSVYLDIQTYVPMYARVKWRDEANNTGTQIKKINRGETVRFNYVMPTATDQEVLVYGGRYLKDVGDLTNLQPTTLLISKAPKLTRLICTNNPNLINTDLSSCTMLQEIDLHGCTMLGGGIGSTPTLNVQKCTNLRRINIYDTQLTAIYTNTSGGNIQEINYPFTVQTVQIHNQPNLKSIGIPVHFINNGNPSNRFATSLVSVDIANCTNLTSMVKNYYEVNGEPVSVPTFLGVSSAQSFKISNSLTHLEQIDLSYCANLRSLSISDFYNLTEINFDDICAWDARYSNLSEISINNCPYVETITFNQNTIDGTNSLGVAFAYGMTLDLSNLLNLKHIRSNVGVKGLQKLIVPPTVRSLVFDYPEDTRYSQQLSDIHSIWSIDAMYAHQDDGYTGIDLRGMDTITDFSMGSLASIDKADNLNIKITNTFPYFNYFRNTDFFKPTGTVDISDYTGSLAYLFKGIDMEKLDIVCDKQLTQTDARYMFAYASCNNDETITSLFSKMQNITDLSYMFYNAYITKAPLLPLSTTDCRYMFYNCPTMTETPANWLQDYPLTPQSDYCYTGCVNIRMIDGQPDTLDSIPSAWGGFGRSNKSYSGYEIHAENTLEREIDTAIASGLTLMNVAPEYGTTPVMTNDQSSFAINEGIDSNILISEGEYETAVLKGYSLTNLAKEKGETQEFERLTEQFEMTDGLDLGVEVVDGEFVEAKFHGNTLHNIVVEDGKTSPITNVTQTFDVDNNIEEGVMVADGDYVSMTIKGNTLTNIVPRYGQTDVVEITGTVNVNDLVSEDVITCDGVMEQAIVKGRTSTNLAKPRDEQQIIFNERYQHYSVINDVVKGGLIEGEAIYMSMEVNIHEINIETDVFRCFSYRDGGGHGYNVLTFNDIKSMPKNTWVKVSTIRYVKEEHSLNSYSLQFGIHGEHPTTAGEQIARASFRNPMWINLTKMFGKGNEPSIAECDTFSYFTGIGSVKSPTIRTETKYPNITKMYNEVTLTGDYVDLSEDRDSFRMTNPARWVGCQFSTFPEKVGANRYDHFCIEFDGELINGGDANNTVLELGWASWVEGGGTTLPQNGKFKGICQTSAFIDANRPFTVGFYLNGETGGINFEYQIKNLRIYKVDLDNRVDHAQTIITTPSDLVLRSVDDTTIDELDLNTGTYTQKIGEFKPTAEQIRGHSYNQDGGYYTCRIHWNNIPNIRKRGNNTVGLFNVLNYKWNFTTGGCWYSHGMDGAYYLSISNATSIEEARQWCIDNDLTILYELETPVVEQLELSKPYSYKDGYITTSSEQLSPTLSCVIPTSNYFPTPQIESNTQYTLYFDNEVSSVNVGGNEVTSPTSPMIVTSGSQKNMKFDGEPSNVMMFKGDVRNQTINYFTGSRSIENVKIVNESSRNLWGIDDIQDEKIIYNNFTHVVSKYIRVYEGEVLYFNSYPNHVYTFARFYDANYQTITTLETTFEGNYDNYKSSIIVPENSRWMKILVRDNPIFINAMMVNRGTDFLPYEECRSYQVNNLYLPPSLTLRSNGNVRDEYNPFTSQFTQRIGEDGSVLSSPVTTTVKSIVAYDGMVKYGYALPDKTTDLYHPEVESYEQVIDSATLDGSENWTKVNQTTFTIPFTNAKSETSTEVFTMKGDVESITIINDTLSLIFKETSYVATNNIAVNALKIWLQTNNIEFKYELKDHVFADMTLEEFDFDNAHFVKPQAYKGGAIIQSNKDDLIFAPITYQTKSNNRYELPLLDSNSDYTLHYEGSVSEVDLGGSTNSSVESNSLVQSGSSDKVVLFNDEVSNVMLIKGDVREQTIPYFQGLLSTQAPVLKAIKADTDQLSTVPFSFFEKPAQDKIGWCSFVFDEGFNGRIRVKLKPDAPSGFRFVCFASKETTYTNAVLKEGIDIEVNNASYIGFHDPNNGIATTNKGNLLQLIKDGDVQITLQEKGKPAIYAYTSIDDIKTSILSTPKDIELRSIGSLCDTLDCKTGELTRYTIEMDDLGNYDMPSYTVHDGTNSPTAPVLKISFRLPLSVVDCGYNATTNLPVICDKFKVRGDANGYSVDRGTYVSTRNGQLFLHLIKEDVGLSTDVWINKEHVQNYFKDNPIRVLCKLQQPIIETVDLDIEYKEGDKKYIVRTHDDVTHVNVSSEGLAPITEIGYITNEDNVETVTLEDGMVTLENAKPHSVIQRAFMTGQTLVNLLDMNNLNQQDSTTYLAPLTTMKSEITIIATNKTVDKSPRVSLYNENGTWVRNVNVSFTNNKIHYKAESGLYVKELVFTTNNIASDSYSYESLEQFREQGFVVIEGNYEKDVPSYFEGIQSCKMPGLRTSNNGCYIINIEKNCYYTGIGGKFTYSANFDTYNVYVEGIDSIKLECDTELSDVSFWDNTNHYISGGFNISYSLSVPSNTKYFKVAIRHGNTNFIVNGFDVINDIKTNILTVNEDVELRGIGDVQDTLDLMTGELTQRIGEVILNGETTANGYTSVDGYIGEYAIHISQLVDGKNEKLYFQGFVGNIGNSKDYILTNGFAQYKGLYEPGSYSELEEGLYRYSGADHAYICISASRFTEHTFEGVKKFLSENPQSYLVTNKESVVKTVDLTLTQQNVPSEKMTYFKDYYGQLVSDGTLPRLTYRLESTNTYNVSQLKPNTLYTMYSEGEATVATLGGKASILLNNPQTLTSGTQNKSLTFDSPTSKVVLIEKDVTNQVVPYFTGTLDTVNPTIKTTSGNKSNTISTNVCLRSVGDVCDTYDLNTGTLVKRVGEDHRVLDHPETSNIPVNAPVAYHGATVEMSSNELSLLPRFEYSCKSPNYYPLPVESNEVYTLKFDKTSNGTLTMGGVTANTTGNQTVTTKNSDVQGVLFSGDLGIGNLMVMKTDVRNVPTPYFRGIQSVVNPTITVSNGGTQSNSVSLTLTMRSLPNGVKDELNLVTGEYIQRLDQRNFAEGDVNGRDMITDGTTTIYPLTVPRRSTLELNWSDGVLTAYDGTTNVTSEAELLKPHLFFQLATSTLEEIISQLKDENASLLETVATLEEDNLSTMVAVTEVFEAVLVMMPMTLSVNNDTKGGGSYMVEVYVTLILKGKKTLEQVPAVIRPQVEQMLKDVDAL